jgi:hypothetical protein
MWLGGRGELVVSCPPSLAPGWLRSVEKLAVTHHPAPTHPQYFTFHHSDTPRPALASQAVTPLATACVAGMVHHHAECVSMNFVSYLDYFRSCLPGIYMPIYAIASTLLFCCL